MSTKSKNRPSSARKPATNGRRLAAIVESATDAIIGKTLDGEITCWNRAAERLYGYSVKEAVGQPISIIVPDDKKEELERIFEKLKSGEAIDAFETTRVAKDGELKSVSLTVSPIVDDCGAVIGASAIARDITERKRSEALLATEHSVSRILSESLSFATASNALLEAITRGVDCELGELWIRDDLRDVLVLLESVTLGGMAELVQFERESRGFEFSIGVGLPGRVWESGQPAWIEDISLDDNVPRSSLARAANLCSGMAFPIDSGKEFLGVMTFFTMRRMDPDPALLNMMRALGTDIGLYIQHMKANAENANFGAIIESSNDAIFSWLPDGTITSWNPEAERVFCRPASEIVGGTVFDIIPKDQVGRAKRIISKLVRGRRGEDLGEIVVKKKGRVLRLLLKISPVNSHTGALVGYSMIARDVTRQRKGEDELRRAKDEAEQANQAKSQFLATMSHEIRNPLNGMLATADLMLYSGLTPEQRELAEILRDSGDQLEILLHDLLDLCKIEAGHLELRIKEFNLRALLDHLTTAWETRATSKGIDYFASIQPGISLSFRGDESRIRQVLENLVSNAVKYTDAGFVAVRVSEVDISDKEGGLRFEVRDTGPGIAPDVKSRLFTRFERGEATEEDQEGIGLGLAICKEIVDLMGGEIAVDSVLGSGSTFSFTVPVTKGLSARSKRTLITPATPRAPLVMSEGNAATLRILVADDNRANRRVLSDILSLAGHSVDVAEDGFEAVAAARDKRYDLIFMDIRMPEMDGVAAVREIRTLGEGGPSVPIVAVTANAMQGDRERYLNEGLTEYIAKPFHMREVLAIVNKHAGASRGPSLPN